MLWCCNLYLAYNRITVFCNLKIADGAGKISFYSSSIFVENVGRCQTNSVRVQCFDRVRKNKQR